jgi:Ca2+-binding RTX toxin-like protein
MGQRSIENILLGGQGKTIALKGEMVRRTILLVSMPMVMLLLGSGAALADVFTGTDGPDSYTGPIEDDSITGSGGEDYLQGDPTPFGSGGNDSVSGGDGDDNISGTLGSDIVSGGDGDDIVGDGPPFDTATDIVFGGAGHDVVDAYNEPPHMDIIYCGPGDDLVYTDGLDHLVDCEASILGPEPDPWELRYLN